MKRLSQKSFFAAIAITLTGIAIALVVFVASTAHGARWFLTSVASLSGVSFSAQTIEGRMIDHLLLKQVRVALAQTNVELDSIELRWKPLRLLIGSVVVQDIALNGLHIQDDTPFDNKLPVQEQRSGRSCARFFDFTIAHVQVTNSTYRRFAEKPVRMTSINGSGSWKDDRLSISGLQAVGLDLVPWLNIQTNISCTLNGSGTLDGYQGDFTFANQAEGWQAATLSASYQGTREGVKLAPLTASLIDGVLSGSLEIGWREGFEIQGEINGRKLNPARIDPDWKGAANFNAAFKIAKAGEAPLRGNVRFSLLESRLHGQMLSGELQAELVNGNISLARLALKGKGFDLHASGELNQRIILAAVVSDLSRLVPGANGALRSNGWVRWHNGQVSGAVVGTGSRLAYAGMRIGAADLNARIDQDDGYSVHVNASLHEMVYTDDMLKSVTIAAEGKMLPGKRFDLDGTVSVSGGTFHQKIGDGELNLASMSGGLTWGWHGETITGTASLALAEYGKAHVAFTLPVPAQFPIIVDTKEPVKALCTGQFQDKGFSAALFPDFVQESFGDLDAELTAAGTWAVPQFRGVVRLARAGAYLPAAGIRLQEVQAAAHLEKQLITIDSFQAVSGPGHIEGTALITLTDWQVVRYQGSIQGDHFQAIHFPELEALISPKLSFEGTLQKFVLRGELLLPELIVIGAPVSNVVAPNSDVVLEKRTLPKVKSLFPEMDVRVRAVIGERVFVKVAEVDAQLGGAVDLSFRSIDRIASSGEITIVKGRFRTYGVDLEIVRGRLFFAGGPFDQPALDFLALRTVGDVRAGVRVTGTLLQPIVKLYSEPAMPDVDVLAYIVLGHPLGNSGEQAGVMAQAAGTLLTSSQASALQERIKSRLGLSTLEIKGGVGVTTSYMGYKPLTVTRPGDIPAEPETGITATTLTVGKYVTPELYISNGRSLFTGGNLFLLRYDITKQWQIETQTGSASGADLFYKMEFK